MRRKDSYQKFLFGLAFEKAGIALNNHQYIDSHTALQICQSILNKIAQENSAQHAFYRQGEHVFNNSGSTEDGEPMQAIPAIFGKNWKRIRYHNLVRLGGDILRSGLAEYAKATILGALCWYANQSDT